MKRLSPRSPKPLFVVRIHAGLPSMIKTRVVGLMGMILASIFGLITLVLGLIQPGYNHLRDPISVLVNGQWGWIQQLNFVVFMLALIMIGLALKQEIWQQCHFKKGLLVSFIICVIGVVVVILFPITSSNIEHLNFSRLTLIGKIHYLATIELLVAMGGFFYFLIEAIIRNDKLKNLVPLSRFVLYFNMLFGSLLFYFNEKGLLVDYLGLGQKILIGNVVIWMVAVGYRLAKFR